jgi:hypothetical protein
VVVSLFGFIAGAISAGNLIFNATTNEFPALYAFPSYYMLIIIINLIFLSGS